MNTKTRVINYILSLLIGLNFIGITEAKEKVVDITAFGANSGDGSDTAPAVCAALEQCKKIRARKLVFPKGRYDFRPDRASEKYVYVSNNDESLKRIAFLLSGIENLEIDGQGSEFIFHGFIAPFVLDHAKNITLKNFSMDWVRTFHSEGVILDVKDDSVDVFFSEQFPYRIENGTLVFTDSDRIVYPFGSWLEFDSRKRETAYQAQDYGTRQNIQAQEISKGRVRLMRPKLKATVGNVFVFGAGHRLCPGITISDSINTKITGVNIYHCGGMGVIVQRSNNIELDQVKVTPSLNSGRILSITADATHFVNCTGKIIMSNCLFENQKDDATNIHGIYARIIKQLAPNEIEVKLVHPQQHGFDFIKPGIKLELVHSPSIITYGEAVVKSVLRLNKEFTRVVFKADLPKEMVEGDAVASLEGYPEVNINHCIIRNNRARGILLGSRAKMVIEDNTFHTPGAAILFEGDARYWYEQAGVRDCIIRRNLFDNCNFGVWGNACIQVGSGIEKSCQAISRYNRGIVIDDNTFRIFDPRLLNIYSVDGLIFRNNKIEKSIDYPAQNQNAKPFEINNCDNVKIEEK
ncbi:MAG: right-handed parallel beta-helix repeat-containing protein [Kiritimatiellae bacterium]|nr:right-handed parallel beta-helix repeat-containing protein [Kiritimatiellia bacterium]MDD5522557.1 right-handed parallel beta-helix repeat-containing protein [Kiritimatiellia bacterium]